MLTYQRWWTDGGTRKIPHFEEETAQNTERGNIVHNRISDALPPAGSLSCLLKVTAFTLWKEGSTEPQHIANSRSTSVLWPSAILVSHSRAHKLAEYPMKQQDTTQLPQLSFWSLNLLLNLGHLTFLPLSWKSLFSMGSSLMVREWTAEEQVCDQSKIGGLWSKHPRSTSAGEEEINGNDKQVTSAVKPRLLLKRRMFSELTRYNHC